MATKTIETMSVEELEASWQELLESYLWFTAHLENLGRKPDTLRRPDHPVNAREYFAWKARHDAVEHARQEYEDEQKVLYAKLADCTLDMANVMPNAFHVLIPAFGGMYDVWISNQTAGPNPMSIKLVESPAPEAEAA